jgi:hypothetical protein
MAVEKIIDEAIGLADKIRLNEETAKFERLMMDDFPFCIKPILMIIDKGRMLFPWRRIMVGRMLQANGNI